MKWSTTIDAKTVRQQVRRAMRTATARRRARCISTSRRARRHARPATPPPSHRSCRTGSCPDRTAPISSRRSTCSASARRPILLVGLGVFWCALRPSSSQFAERLGAPVLTTTKCKGMIPEDHPLRAGCIIGGLIERKLVMQSDLIITVGLDAVELQPKPWPYTLPVLALASAAEPRRVGAGRPGVRWRSQVAAGGARASGHRRAAVGARRQPRTSARMS